MSDIKLIYGDCIEKMNELIDQGIRVDLIITDPPYLMNYKTNHRLNKSHDFCSTIPNDDNYKMIEDFVSLSYEILKDNTAFYCFCNQNKIDFFKKTIEKHFKIKNIIVWVKNNWTAGDLRGAFGKQYEFIILANKGRYIFNGKRITDVWNFDRISGKKQLHQNQKPVELIELCLEKHSKSGDLVLDPFMGSGTTGVACINKDRDFIGIELNKSYFNIAMKRNNLWS